MTIRYNFPHIPVAVNRPRLFKLLDAQYGKQNFIISGRAAQGKTTLVASYLRQKEVPVLWIDLSGDDSNFVVLHGRLAGALDLICVKDRLKKTHASSFPVMGIEKGVPRCIEELLAMLKNAPSGLCIVLDDLERIKVHSTGFKLITGLMAKQIPHLKFFLLSRRMPQLDFTNPDITGNEVILKNSDLSFTLDETMTFFRNRKELQPGEIRQIHSLTDGWAGGLTIIAESMNQFRQTPLFPGPMPDELFRYFSKKIYQDLPARIRIFLSKTALLDTIDIDIANQLLEEPDALNILEAIEKRNLFIRRIGSDVQKPIFKFHTLFKSFLLQDLVNARGPDGVRRLNKTIGTFYWDRRDHISAMNYYMRANAHEEMIRIIKIKGTDHIIRGRITDLEKWFSCLPENCLKQDTWLIFFKTMSRRIKGGKKNINRFQEIYSRFETLGDTRGILLATACLIEAMVFIRQPAAMTLEWIQRGENHLQSINDKKRYPWARALLLQHIGLGYIAGYGNLPKGISACRNAMLLARQINARDMVLNAYITMTSGYVQAGDFAGAGKTLAKIRAMTDVKQHPEYQALKRIVDIDFAFKRGRFKQCGHLLDRSEAEIEKFGLIFLYPEFIEARALYLAYTARYKEATRTSAHLNDFSALEGNRFYKGISRRINAICFLLQKQYPRAETEIRKAMEHFGHSMNEDIHYYTALQILGLIRFRQKAYSDAIRILEPVLHYFRKISSELNAVETCFILGIAAFELGDHKKGLTHLSKGVEKADNEKYLFFPLTGSDLPARSILLLAGHGLLKASHENASSIIRACPDKTIFCQMDKIIPGMELRKKARAVEHLAPFYRSRLPRLMIKTLGQFQIRLGSSILEPKAFEGAKPVRLLKAIVLHGARDIPKEILIDDLWPGAKAGAGEKNFKINLHRLRRAIEPAHKKTFGHSYIIQKAGLISLDPDLVRTDAEEFTALITSADSHIRSNRLSKALECYENACRVYKGDYFTEEPYLEWVMPKRNQLRSRYIELLQKKAALHEELDQQEKAIRAWSLVLNTDPFMEPACQNLMILYADSGQKKKALDLFTGYVRLLKNELGTAPMAETITLFNTICSR